MTVKDILAMCPPMVAVEMVTIPPGVQFRWFNRKDRWVGFDEASGGYEYASDHPMLYPESDVQRRMTSGGYRDSVPHWRVHKAEDVMDLNPSFDHDPMAGIAGR